MKSLNRLILIAMACGLTLSVLAGPLTSLRAAQTATNAATVGTDEAALIESMKARLPELMKLKLDESVGESNRGLVEIRGNLNQAQRRLVAAENSDRLAHYKIIADKLGISVAAVQHKRAEQIRENSPSGVWIESRDGVWSQK